MRFQMKPEGLYVTGWMLFFFFVSSRSDVQALIPSTKTAATGRSVSSPATRSPSSRFPLVAVAAKKKPKRSGGGGGFGSKQNTKSTAVDDDYAVFPALEPRILETLVPAPVDWQQEAGPLPLEILDRLDQIYGFSNFNGQAASGKEETNLIEMKTSVQEPLSLDTLLTLPDEGDDSTETAATDGSSSKQIMKDAIACLPPFTDFRILHIDPLVLAIDDFMTSEECGEYINLADESALHSQTSPTVGTGATARAQRTSTTWYHAYERVPALLTKACALLGLSNVDGWEEVQTVRYRRQEHFSWHLDALNESNLPAAGQRIATLLVYLTDSVQGGATMFRDLELSVVPRQGSALLFFPAAGGVPGCPPDYRTLHCGQMVDRASQQDKWIGQIWLRPKPYHVTVGTSHQDPIVAQAMSDYAAQFRGQTTSSSR